MTRTHGPRPGPITKLNREGVGATLSQVGASRARACAR